MKIKEGDKVKLSSKCGEYCLHPDELFTVTDEPRMLGKIEVVRIENDETYFAAFSTNFLVKVEV